MLQTPQKEKVKIDPLNKLKNVRNVSDNILVNKKRAIKIGKEKTKTNNL